MGRLLDIARAAAHKRQAAGPRAQPTGREVSAFSEWPELPLSEFERRHVALRIESREYGRMWLVSTEAERSLAHEGEPIYTAEEARRVVDLAEPLVRQIHALKKTLGCRVERVEEGAPPWNGVAPPEIPSGDYERFRRRRGRD